MDQELEDRIAQGQELLKQTTAAMTQLSPVWPPSDANYRPERDKYYTWDDYNEQLLRSRFSTGRLADPYRSSKLVMKGSSPWLTLAVLANLAWPASPHVRIHHN